MDADTDGASSGLRLRIRAQRETIQDIKSLGTLQTVHEARDAAVVAVNGGIEGPFDHAAIGDFLLPAREGDNLEARLLGDVVEVGRNRRGAGARTRKGMLELFTIQASGGHLIFDVLGGLNVVIQEAELDSLFIELLLRRMGRRGELPTVNGQADIGGQEEAENDENSAFL